MSESISDDKWAKAAGRDPNLPYYEVVYDPDLGAIAQVTLPDGSTATAADPGVGSQGPEKRLTGEATADGFDTLNAQRRPATNGALS